MRELSVTDFKKSTLYDPDQEVGEVVCDGLDQKKSLVQVNHDSNDRYRLTIFWSEANGLI